MALRVRDATPSDGVVIHRFVQALADYEREPDAVEATPETFRDQLADDRSPFRCLVAELDDSPVGIALYYVNYSTWRGRPGLYLEDIFVDPPARRRGVARALMARLAARVVDGGYARFEWSVLDWNELAMGFYEALGAKPLREWILYRMSDDDIRRLAADDSDA